MDYGIRIQLGLGNQDPGRYDNQDPAWFDKLVPALSRHMSQSVSAARKRNNSEPARHIKQSGYSLVM
jgi:hypothetical protein